MGHIQRTRLWDLVPAECQYLLYVHEYLETNRKKTEVIEEVLSIIGLNELILLSGNRARQNQKKGANCEFTHLEQDHFIGVR
jgi:hypothetical protein